MQEAKMSIQTRKEILIHIQNRYKAAGRHDKNKILDEFVATTGYGRKYAITLLNRPNKEQNTVLAKATMLTKRSYRIKYDEATKQALLTIWYAANQICSKRLVPFIPELTSALERFGHIALPPEVRSKLLSISPATVDRLLKIPRNETAGMGISTTRPGSLLKKQIKIRTFTDWDDIVPGFFEGDLVAHCGDNVAGSFLNTLVLTDIASGWTEFFALLKKGEADVIASLGVAQALLPFPILGLDTDNGSEFINYGLLAFCKNHKITFTRSRAYKKNDQAHVEEKNGSIVRRLIGYDRFEGVDAYNALSELYASLRLYVNFFQPSLKLISKTRDEAKVTKKYDKAKTPCQRLLLSPHLSIDAKTQLQNQYDKLDPIALLKDLERLQDNLWKHAWSEQVQIQASSTEVSAKIIPYTSAILSELVHINSYEHPVAMMVQPQPVVTQAPYIVNLESVEQKRKKKQVIDLKIKTKIDNGTEILQINKEPQINLRRYKSLKNSKRKQLAPRWWRTRPDDFAAVWPKISMQLSLNPTLTATGLLDDLIRDYPEQFNLSKIRALQKKVASWRKEQIKAAQEERYQNSLTAQTEVNKYISLVAHSMINGYDNS